MPICPNRRDVSSDERKAFKVVIHKVLSFFHCTVNTGSMAAAVDGSRLRIEARSAAGLTEAWLGAVHLFNRFVQVKNRTSSDGEKYTLGGAKRSYGRLF